MKAIATSILRAVASAAVLGLIPAALAHGDDMNMEAGEADKPRPAAEYPPTYFAHPEHQTVIYAHIALMVLGWVFVLPIAVMFSLARSRYTLAAQFLFTAVNAAGVLLAIIYDANTPDLYPNNAHHKLGWVVTWVAGAQLAISVLSRVAGALGRKAGDQTGDSHERVSFIPVSTEAIAEHESQFPLGGGRRFSNDSGQGTEPKTESLRSPSLSSGGGGADSPGLVLHNVPLRRYGDDDIEAAVAFPRSGGAVYTVAEKAAGLVSSRSWKPFTFLYHCVDRVILILGFIALCTGIATFGRFFEGPGIFSGLAHWIKGGVFIWLGIFTLGRWAGSFSSLGWAWNLRPPHPTWRRPSAEFVESALIFLYGATNIFLEHLGNAGGAWSAQDLEHVSITVLFLGGGLLGMLIESVSIRDLLNTTPTTSTEEEEEPDSYRTSTNPVPALVILLLGSIMSSHTQPSRISTMVHKQWGQLLAGASVARGVTYLVMWLKPPTSARPSRPPTEVLAAFGLVSGGTIFMASAADTVNGMIHYELDAMFMYTVTMGLVGLLMAWIVLVIAVKGWAVRRERRAGRS
ncbi:hypothetical protein QBC39DRAFT_353831 [Podospora conica]|nr:hypothetical protein QBC39DRAFT_353831 [Schizothecium conicum]